MSRRSRTARQRRRYAATALGAAGVALWVASLVFSRHPALWLPASLALGAAVLVYPPKHDLGERTPHEKRVNALTWTVGGAGMVLVDLAALEVLAPVFLWAGICVVFAGLSLQITVAIESTHRSNRLRRDREREQ